MHNADSWNILQSLYAFCGLSSHTACILISERHLENYSLVFSVVKQFACYKLRSDGIEETDPIEVKLAGSMVPSQADGCWPRYEFSNGPRVSWI